jgi:hypothetical protein
MRKIRVLLFVLWKLVVSRVRERKSKADSDQRWIIPDEGVD